MIGVVTIQTADGIAIAVKAGTGHIDGSEIIATGNSHIPVFIEGEVVSGKQAVIIAACG